MVETRTGGYIVDGTAADSPGYIQIAVIPRWRPRALDEAQGIARERSADKSVVPWIGVYVKDAASGEILHTYVDGQLRLPESLPGDEHYDNCPRCGSDQISQDWIRPHVYGWWCDTCDFTWDEAPQ